MNNENLSEKSYNIKATKKYCWPNQYQLAILLGCKDEETVLLVKNRILNYSLSLKKEDKMPDFLSYSIVAVNEYWCKKNTDKDFEVNMDNVNVSKLNQRDLNALVSFGINSYYLTECLKNKLIYSVKDK